MISDENLLTEITSLKVRVNFLERQMLGQRNFLARTWELLDVLATPPWRRLKFAAQGFKLWSVGRWYGRDKEKWSNPALEEMRDRN